MGEMAQERDDAPEVEIAGQMAEMNIGEGADEVVNEDVLEGNDTPELGNVNDSAEMNIGEGADEMVNEDVLKGNDTPRQHHQTHLVTIQVQSKPHQGE